MLRALSFGTALLLLSALPAAAQGLETADWGGFYAGAFAALEHAQFGDDGQFSSNGAVSGGVVAGARLQLFNLVLGLEGDWSGGSTATLDTGIVALEDAVTLDSQASVRGRAGVALGPLDLYLTGGVAVAHSPEDNHPWLGGTSVGAGAEWALSDTLSLDLLALRTTLRSPDILALTLGETVQQDSVRLGLNVRF